VLQAVALKNVSALSGFFSPDCIAVIPRIEPAQPIDKARLLSWLQAYCEGTGTMRLDLAAVVHGTPDSAGAVVTHTAFSGPGSAGAGTYAQDAQGGDKGRVPYWFTVPTICAGNSVSSGTALERFFFLTDNAGQPNRSAMLDAVTAWYTAYMNHDVAGFLCSLADDLQACSYNSYESSQPVSKSDYHTGFEKWIAGNEKGGYIVTQILADGNWVGVAVQFLTRAAGSGQQKMTSEIHLIELDAQLKIRRAYFYETDRCGYPASPCAW
jgi:ketosteroid isomerase-like protein